MNNKEYFEENGFCIVKNAISEEVRSIVENYTLFDEKQNLILGDIQSPLSHSKYGDPLMESLLLHLKGSVEENTGLSLFPTYSYYRVYRNGATLNPHKDRESCEISSTLCIGYNYDDKFGIWPIVIGDFSIELGPGDMAIYRGIDLVHSRPDFSALDHIFHSQVFLHYVDQNGPYKDFKFDKRTNIGDKKD